MVNSASEEIAMSLAKFTEKVPYLFQCGIRHLRRDKNFSLTLDYLGLS